MLPATAASDISSTCLPSILYVLLITMYPSQMQYYFPYILCKLRTFMNFLGSKMSSPYNRLDLMEFWLTSVCTIRHYGLLLQQLFHKHYTSPTDTRKLTMASRQATARTAWPGQLYSSHTPSATPHPVLADIITRTIHVQENHLRYAGNLMNIQNSSHSYFRQFLTLLNTSKL